jgi:hypothetical protein
MGDWVNHCSAEKYATSDANYPRESLRPKSGRHYHKGPNAAFAHLCTESLERDKTEPTE